MNRLLLSKPIVRFVLFTERWILSLLFLFLAYEALSTLLLMELVRVSRSVMPPQALARDAGFLDGVHFEDYARYGLLMGSNLISGILLLLSRRPSGTPTRAEQVVIPLVATFGYMVFNQYIPFPVWMTIPRVPPAWIPCLAGLGIVSSMVGAVVSLGSMLWLGRSLGIVVSVREIITGGPYRFVRHPIYFGYMLVFMGLLLTACNVRMLLMTACGSLMLVWRARIEERMLCEHSPAYCEWMKVTGFFWPRARHGCPVRVVRVPAADSQQESANSLQM